MFSRSIIEDSRNMIEDSRSTIEESRSINDTSGVIRLTTVSDASSCGVILMTLDVSFTIVMFL